MELLLLPSVPPKPREAGCYIPSLAPEKSVLLPPKRSPDKSQLDPVLPLQGGKDPCATSHSCLWDKGRSELP